MFRACLDSSAKVVEAVDNAIGQAIFTYVSLVTVTAMVDEKKTVTKEHVQSVEALLEKKYPIKNRTQNGGMGMDTTGINNEAYNTSNGAGTNAASVNFVNGIARSEHTMQGGTCTAAIHAAIQKEIKLIMKDQNMRKKSGVLDLITRKIEDRIRLFLHPLVSSTISLRVSDVNKAKRIAFRGLCIL